MALAGLRVAVDPFFHRSRRHANAGADSHGRQFASLDQTPYGPGAYAHELPANLLKGENELCH
jgi:hypothetical protein